MIKEPSGVIVTYEDGKIIFLPYEPNWIKYIDNPWGIIDYTYLYGDTTSVASEGGQPNG